MFWSYGRLGLAFDGILRRASNRLDFKPYGLFRIKSSYILAGFSTSSTGAEYFQAGAWYRSKHHGLSVFLDTRNFWGFQKAVSYTENFLEITATPSQRTWVGFDTIYDHWWNNQSCHFLLSGPVAGVFIAKPVLLFVRVSREWNWASGAKTQSANRFRLGLKLTF